MSAFADSDIITGLVEVEGRVYPVQLTYAQLRRAMLQFLGDGDMTVYESVLAAVACRIMYPVAFGRAWNGVLRKTEEWHRYLLSQQEEAAKP
jgi:hypothetical protein